MIKNSFHRCLARLNTRNFLSSLPLSYPNLLYRFAKSNSSQMSTNCKNNNISKTTKRKTLSTSSQSTTQSTPRIKCCLKVTLPTTTDYLPRLLKRMNKSLIVPSWFSSLLMPQILYDAAFHSRCTARNQPSTQPKFVYHTAKLKSQPSFCPSVY